MKKNWSARNCLSRLVSRLLYDNDERNVVSSFFDLMTDKFDSKRLQDIDFCH